MAPLVKPGRAAVGIAPDLPDHPTLVHALGAAAERVPDRTAVICEDRALSYLEYARAVGGMARLLDRHGVRGGRVAIMMGSSPEAGIAGLGAMAAGAQTAPVNPAYGPDELAPLLGDAEAAVVLCDGPRADLARALAPGFGIREVLIAGEGAFDVDAWSKDPDLGLPDRLPGAGDPAAMFFTGGTTGVPKGAEHPHRSLLAFSRQVTTLLEFSFDVERILNVAPMFHIFGHHFTNVLPVYLGATLVIVPEYRPARVLEALERHRITFFSGGPPTVYLGLLGAEGIASADLSALRCCLCGAAPCPEDVFERWEAATGSVLVENAGMSEGAPVANNPFRGPRKRGSIGVTPPETEIDVVDLETGRRVLPPGERGEIRVRGPQFTTGYRNRPDETARAIRDGWLYTGDVGYFDEDGYLFLVDRRKEIVKTGGFTVYPREVDEVLHRHPAVLECATVGVADPYKGERVIAFVALRPDHTVTGETLIAHCRERLVDYKVPREIRFLDTLPKTGPGKIDKLALRGLR